MSGTQATAKRTGERRDRMKEALRETALTIALIAVCFMIFLGLVHFSFPEGISLRGLIRPGSESVWSDADNGERHAELARLVRAVRKVKDKPADGIAWRDADLGLSLGTKHAIQTHDRSSATIAFGDDNELTLGENSLIVLRSFDGRDDGSERRATVMVFGGELRGRLGGGGAGSLSLQVETPGGEARITSATEGNAPTFRVSVAEDSSSTVAVYDGAAEFESGGRTVRVEANQSVWISAVGEIAGPSAVPGAPELVAPKDSEAFPFRITPPDVGFRWRTSHAADSYRLVISRDEAQEEVVHSTVLDELESVIGTLEPGRYYWTVAALNDEVASPPQPLRTFHLDRDDKAPVLEVQWPEGSVSQKSVRLTGLTEVGAHVFVSNERARVDASGRFEIDVALSRGANSIVVEAVDEVGNSAYQTKLIKALY